MESASVKGADEAGKTSGETPAPPILAKDIKETVTVDVVVLGAGIAGLSASLSAAEAGAKTVALEKAPAINFRGCYNAALASRLQKKEGVKNDKGEIIYHIMQWGAYRNDQKVVKLWADNCDQVMDWILDMCDDANVEPHLLDTAPRPWYFQNFSVAHFFGDLGPTGWPAEQNLAELLFKYARMRGVDFRFKTPAVRLLREGRGRVGGVIARNPDGHYVQYNAQRGVVLCTGDYGSDKEMVKKYVGPWCAELDTPYPQFTTFATGLSDGRVNTGDGHKMGMWIGAAIDDPPHCPMLFDWGAEKEDPLEQARGFFDIHRQPWLYVNLRGERFMNEDIPWAYEVNQIVQQPGGFAWSVFDAKCDQEFQRFNCQCCKHIGPPTGLYREGQISERIKSGEVLPAGTIEELARKIGVPVKTFEATVKRYNELARSGNDVDFNKQPNLLTTVEKPPFYAGKFKGCYLVIVGGLKINTNLQVLDTEQNPIPGLYAAGNASGSFFGDQYPTTMPGLSHSRAWTFGRLAGLKAAAEKA